MLTRQRQLRTRVLRIVDTLLFVAAFYFAYWLRTNIPESVLNAFDLAPTEDIRSFSEFAWLIFVILPAAPILLQVQGFYNRPFLASRRQTGWQLFKVCVLLVVIVVLVMFLFKTPLARSVPITFGIMSFCLVMLKEELLRRWIQTNIGQAQLKKRLILIGSEEDTSKLLRDLPEAANEGIEVLAKVNMNNTSVEDLVEMLHDHAANGVIINAAHTYFGRIEKVIQACELEGVEAWLCADFFKTQISQTSVDDFYGRPMLVFRSAPEASWQSVAKRAVDFVGALVLLVVLAIPLGIACLLIKLSSSGPVLFSQTRSGLNGQPFTMYKLRTMTNDADQRKEELQKFNEMEGPVFKLSNDPRVTRVGAFLRRYSIDEFPQLYNVLRGEMSLVGPRPLPVDEVRRFHDLAHRRRLSVKPGLTCLWQISGRNDVQDFRDWVRLDLEYIDNWSIWLDLRILVRTIPIVLTGSGAR